MFPVYWMVNMSFTPGNKIISRTPSLLPLDFTWQNYVTAWTREAAPGQTDFPHALLTSTIVTIGVIVVTLLFAFLASVAVARFHFRGRRGFIVAVLIVQMVPGEAMMFTIYGMIDDWHLMNTMLGLGIVYVAAVVPFTIWTLRGFVAGVPADLEEAAMIDGCTKSQAFWRVTFPLLAPGLVATGIFAFIQSWNEFTMALLLMKGYNLTLPDLAQLLPVRHRGHQLGRRHGRLDDDRHPGRDLLPLRAGADDGRPGLRGGQGLMGAHAAADSHREVGS